MQSTAQTCVYTPSNVRPGFASKTAKYLGMAQIFLGAICIIFQIVGIILMAWKAFIGAGIWCGAIFVIGGSFGVTSSHRKSNCTIITFMVMSILSAVFTMVPLASCAEAISFDSSYHMSYYRDFGVQSTRKARLAVNSILLVCVLVELFVAIWSAAICCRATCCLPGAYGLPYQVQYVPHGGPQPVVLLAPPQNQTGVLYALPQGSNTYVIQQGGTSVPIATQQVPMMPSNPQMMTASAPPAYSQNQSFPPTQAYPPPQIFPQPQELVQHGPGHAYLPQPEMGATGQVHIAEMKA